MLQLKILHMKQKCCSNCVTTKDIINFDSTRVSFQATWCKSENKMLQKIAKTLHMYSLEEASISRFNQLLYILFWKEWSLL